VGKVQASVTVVVAVPCNPRCTMQPPYLHLWVMSVGNQITLWLKSRYSDH
jgi:hypothetical protein